MVSTVEDAAATQRQTLSKASVKKSQALFVTIVKSEALRDEISLDCLKTVLSCLENGPNYGYVDVRKDGGLKNFVLGKNMHGSSLEITEPDHDDEVRGEKDAYMASVLARYRKSLTEKSKYHLGALALTIWTFLSLRSDFN